MHLIATSVVFLRAKNLVATKDILPSDTFWPRARPILGTGTHRTGATVKKIVNLKKLKENEIEDCVTIFKINGEIRSQRRVKKGSIVVNKTLKEKNTKKSGLVEDDIVRRKKRD